MITSPLNLDAKVKEHNRYFDAFPFIDLCLIGLFIALFNSKFIFAPGVNIELPQIISQELQGVPATSVLTMRENDMIIFEGQIFNIDSLKKRLMKFSIEEERTNPILLVKLDKNVNVQQMMKILDIARPYFSRVQLAADEKTQEADIFSNVANEN